MSPDNSALVLEIFRAIEARNGGRFAELLEDDFEISWPPSRPYGGTSRGVKAKQPTGERLGSSATNGRRATDGSGSDSERSRSRRLWRQSGMSPSGENLEGEVLGFYEVGNGKLKRAQMFYFDTAAVANFLARANQQAT